MDYLSVSNEEPHKIKVVLVGDRGVGKTNIMNRFSRNIFQYTSQTTIGFQYAERIFYAPIDKRQKFSIHIWDAAGIEDGKNLNPMFFKNVLGVIYVYDRTRQETFQSLSKWKKIVHDNLNIKFVNEIVLGNKTDLKRLQEVNYTQAKQWADRQKISLVYQTSALANTAIQDAFFQLITEITKRMGQKRDKLLLNPASLPKEASHRGCC